MADGPAIYPQSYYGTSPLDKFVTGALEGWGKTVDIRTKSDALSMQLMENSKKREAAAERDRLTPGKTAAGTTTDDMSSGYDSSSATGGAGASAGPTLQDGVGGARENWETTHNNFAGMRKVGGPARGPNAGGFQEFATPEAGVQAIANQLDRYISGATTGKPLTTIRQIVSTWAPPNDKNPTEALIANMSTITGLDPNTPIDFANPAMKAKVVEGMIRNEQGGYLHPNAAAAIPKVFGVADWQPYRRPQQQPAIGGATPAAPSASAGAPPIPSAPTPGSEAPSAGNLASRPDFNIPTYNPQTLARVPVAALGPAPPVPALGVPPGAQTLYSPPPQAQPTDYAAAQQSPYAALVPPASGLFG